MVHDDDDDDDVIGDVTGNVLTSLCTVRWDRAALANIATLKLPFRRCQLIHMLS